ncbi:hypothetical protein [Bacillus sp. JZ34]
MNWLEFFSSVLNSGPLAIVLVVLILKKPLALILNRAGGLLNLKYKDVFEINFSKVLDKIENEKEKNMKGETNGPVEEQKVVHTINDANNTAIKEDHEEYDFSRDKVDNEVFDSMAWRSPQEAVYSAWLELEKELRYMLVRIGKSTMLDIPPIVDNLVNEGYISKKTRGIILSLWQLRTAVARDYDEAKSITYTDAKRYYNITSDLIKKFQSIQGEYYASSEKLS